MRRHYSTTTSCFVIPFQGGSSFGGWTKYRSTQQSSIPTTIGYNDKNKVLCPYFTTTSTGNKNITGSREQKHEYFVRTYQYNQTLVYWNNRNSPTLNVFRSGNLIRSLSSSSSSSHGSNGTNTLNHNGSKNQNNYNQQQQQQSLDVNDKLYENGTVLNLLDSIVTIVRTNRIHILKHRWRYEQELSYEHRHQITRDFYNFCTFYPKLPSLFTKQHNSSNQNHHSNNWNDETHRQQSSTTFAERQAILNYLLTQTVVSETSLVQEALESFYPTATTTTSDTNPSDSTTKTSSNSPTISPTILVKMKRVCTPLYEDLIQLLLEVTAGLGLQCLITLRYDLLLYKKYLKGKHVQKQRSATQNDNNKDTTTPIGSSSSSILDPVLLLEQLSVFDEYIQQVLTIHFAPGFLDIHRITYQQSSAATIEMIAKYEAVHPVQDLHDLRARLGEHRRVFGLFHPKLVPNYIPAVVLYVSLQTTIPSSMHQIHNQQTMHPSPTVATFYSISNLQPGLSGVGLGEYLIKQSVTKLQAELPSLSTFVTLSPLPNFRKWVQKSAIQLASSVLSIAEETPPWIDLNDLQQLADVLQCEPNKALGLLLQVVDSEKSVTRSGVASVISSPSSNQDNNSIGVRIDSKLIERILMRLAAYYITKEKYRRKPLDSVARFHLSNGAEVYRLNYAADLSRKGWSNSFGIMINYQYNLESIRYNQDQYESSYAITIHPNVQKLLDY